MVRKALIFLSFFLTLFILYSSISAQEHSITLIIENENDKSLVDTFRVRQNLSILLPPALSVVDSSMLRQISIKESENDTINYLIRDSLVALRYRIKTFYESETLVRKNDTVKIKLTNKTPIIRAFSGSYSNQYKTDSLLFSEIGNSKKYSDYLHYKSHPLSLTENKIFFNADLRKELAIKAITELKNEKDILKRLEKEGVVDPQNQLLKSLRRDIFINKAQFESGLIDKEEVADSLRKINRNPYSKFLYDEIVTLSEIYLDRTIADIKGLNSKDKQEAYLKAIESDMFDQNIREHLFFNLFQRQSSKMGQEELSGFGNYILPKLKNQNLRQQIIETLSIYGKITDNTEVSLRDKDKNQFSLKEVLQKHKGKYVYIDFWASWCQPCLEMFPYSFKLSEKFSSSTVFLYLSIDKNFNNWIKSASKNKLTDPRQAILFLISMIRNGLNK